LKAVGESDEAAFALLKIDNYEGDGAAAIIFEGENIRRKQTKTASKYTGKTQG
jgi:hypothetical protein